jgi:rRNA maturation RNase YbeY
VLSFSYLEGHEEHCVALAHGEVDLDGFVEGPWPDDEEPLAGQVLVSLQTLERVGPVHTGEREAELAFMVVHGMLHVLGHDHADDVQSGVMRAFERELMARIGYPLVAVETDSPGGVES